MSGMSTYGTNLCILIKHPKNLILIIEVGAHVSFFFILDFSRTGYAKEKRVSKVPSLRRNNIE
jgi:hypothetical protein